MAKVKSIIDADQIRLYGSLDSNLNGTNFNNTASQTIFSFGSFVVTSNFAGRTPIDYSTKLSSFVRPVTLETMGMSDVESEILLKTTTEAVLNLDKSDLNTFVRFGSAYEFLRTSIEQIILNYPASIFVSSKVLSSGNITFTNFNYNSITNTSYFEVPIAYIVNTFGILCNKGNSGYTDNELRNLNLSFENYIIWSAQNSSGNSYSVIGFTGYCTNNSSLANYNKLVFKVRGNPFPNFSGLSGNIDFHIKPNNVVFEQFRAQLTDYQKFLISERDGVNGFNFIIKDPTLLDDGNIVYTDSQLNWSTSDGYNIDISTAKYRRFLESMLNIGSKYDSIKTDLIARFLTPLSLKTYDLTEEGKVTKLLRLYGREFDELKQFIDSLVYINRVSYDKTKNIPDQLVRNLARTFGWNYFSLINEDELVESFLTINDEERNLNTDLMPSEIDIELWRRILINTNYFWKAKGTREAIKAIFLMIGIPEPFINITEYVYTVEGKINPNTVSLALEDFPTQSLPYDSDGYPVAPLEANNFYFQMSGNTDSGQAYMDIFRSVGFNLTPTVDNKKSWVEAGAITRIDDTAPQYYQEDSRLVLNTKEVDIALDTARGIEYDVYDYIKNTDFPANSSGYTLPYSFVNISLGFTASANTFTLPAAVNRTMGDFEVRYNGILLNAPKSGTTTGFTTEADYTIDYATNTFTLTGGNFAYNNPNRRDVIQATYIFSGGSAPVSGISVQYIVTRVSTNSLGTVIPLPSMPRGDVQVTLNGIALTKGSSTYTADYIVDPANTTGSSRIIVQNPALKPYLSVSPYLQVAYVEVVGSNDISARNEVLRIDSFSTSKIYYNSGANKYVYKLNYKANNASELKVLIDGIALEPNTDYTLNTMNPYEIFLPKGLHYGSVISVYYLVGGNAYFNPVVSDEFGVGDISQLSFLEFIELIQRRMINVRNRKTISDFKGGWYPTLLNVYIQYLQRAELSSTDPLLSNGYTFENLYSFLSKYNAFFQRFVDELLSATIILKKGGLLIRNSVFTKQKFTYKRGVNLYMSGSSTSDMRGNVMIQYLGDDGSEFIIAQEDAPPPLILHVDTIMGSACYGLSGIGSIQSTGGIYVSGYTDVTDYGMEYKCSTSGTWMCEPTPLCQTLLSVSSYPATICNLIEGSSYDYRAVVKSDTVSAYGDTISVTIPIRPIDPVIITPTAHTRIAGSLTCNAIVNTGGYILPIGLTSGVTSYGMQYSAGTKYYIPTLAPTVQSGHITISTTTTLTSMSNKLICDGCLPIQEYGVVYTQNLAQCSCLCYGNSSVCKRYHTNYISGGTWYSDTLTGLTQNTCTYYRAYAKNATGVGYGTICCGNTCSVGKPVSFSWIPGGCIGSNGSSAEVSNCACLYGALSAGQSYTASLYYTLCKGPTLNVDSSCFHVIRYRSGICSTVFCNSISSKGTCCCISGNVPVNVLYGDCIHVITKAKVSNGSSYRAMSQVSISSAASPYGHIVSSSQTSYRVYTCGSSYGSIIDGGEFIELID